jgi:hypothetical protein
VAIWSSVNPHLAARCPAIAIASDSFLAENDKSRVMEVPGPRLSTKEYSVGAYATREGYHIGPSPIAAQLEYR